MSRVIYHYMGYKYDNGCVFDCKDNPIDELPDWFQEIVLERHAYIGEFEHMIQEILETSNWRK